MDGVAADEVHRVRRARRAGSWSQPVDLSVDREPALGRVVAGDARGRDRRDQRDLAVADEVEHLVGLVDLDVVGRLGVARLRDARAVQLRPEGRRRPRPCARAPAPSGRRRRSRRSRRRTSTRTTGRVVQRREAAGRARPPPGWSCRAQRFGGRRRRGQLAADRVEAGARQRRQPDADASRSRRVPSATRAPPAKLRSKPTVAAADHLDADAAGARSARASRRAAAERLRPGCRRAWREDAAGSGSSRRSSGRSASATWNGPGSAELRP